MIKYAAIKTLLTSLLLVSSFQIQAADFDPRKPVMTKLADGVYQYFQGFYNSLIVVTDEGVVLTDPAGKERAALMRKQIRKITDQPIVKVIYSHDHYDHTRGGQIFKDEGAQFITNERCVDLLKRDPYNEVVQADITYDEELSVTTGGKTIELKYYGPNDGNCMSVIYMPKEKLLLGVDFHLPLYVNEPYRLVSHDYGGIYQTMKRIRKELDYKIVISGHWPVSSPELFEEDFRFVETLYNAVLEGMKQGKTTEELKNTVKLPEFSHWRGYEKNLPAHVERMAYTIWHGN